MSLRAPMSRIPVRNRNGSGVPEPTRLEQMQKVLQERIRQENLKKLENDKAERMLQVYAGEQERANRQLSKYGYDSGRAQAGTNVGGVRNYFQSKRLVEANGGDGLRGKPPLPAHHHKNSAGRDRANPLVPLNHRAPQSEYDDGGGVLGQGGSPTGIRVSPKPQGRSKLAGRPKPQSQPQRRAYGTPYDSGNESSGYEDQNLANLTYNVNKKTPSPKLRQYQASSEEDLNTEAPPKQPSFQEWKRSRAAGKAKVANLHSGHNKGDPPPMSDFQKFQAEQDRDRADRLQRYRDRQQLGREDTASSPEVAAAGDAPSHSSSSHSARVAAELKQKEQQLLDMIQKQQQELQAMKLQREKDEAEEEREAQQEREKRKRELAEGREKRKREQREQEQREREEREREPSPQPPVLRKARRVKPVAARKAAPPSPPPSQPGEQFFDTSDAAQFYADAAAGAGADTAGGQQELVPCGLCGRRFVADRIKPHQVTCEKVQRKAANRKAFDASKMRTGGTEMAQYVNAKKPEPKKRDTGDWRKKREDFIKAMRYAKQVTAVEKQGGDVSALPPPPRTENAHYKQCPWCERRFAPETAERHIPKCKDIKSRPAPVKAKPLRRGR